MDYSSPQSFGRHLRAVLGVTAGEFRRRFPFDVALTRYVDLLITPYREACARFTLQRGSWDQGRTPQRSSGRVIAALVGGGPDLMLDRALIALQHGEVRHSSAQSLASCASCCDVVVSSPIDVI